MAKKNFAAGMTKTGVLNNMGGEKLKEMQAKTEYNFQYIPKEKIISNPKNEKYSQDGIDVSWLWDVDFDRFQDAGIHSITVSGIRCRDMQLRLKYVDIPSILEPDIEKAIQDRIKDGVKNLYVLVNYTGLYKTHNILKKLEGEQK